MNGSSGLSLPSNKSALGVCQVVITQFNLTGSNTNRTGSCGSTLSKDCAEGVMDTISQGLANSTFDTDDELQSICQNISYSFDQATIHNSFNLFRGCGISKASVSAPASLPSNQTCTVNTGDLDPSISPGSTWQYVGFTVRFTASNDVMFQSNCAQYGGFDSQNLVVALVYVPRKNASVAASGSMMQMMCAPGDVQVDKLGPLSTSTASTSTSTALGSNLLVPGASAWTYGAGLLGLLYAL